VSEKAEDACSLIQQGNVSCLSVPY